jgi:beta-phosphoglucomutase-like phosphatase (HAD superfamily)
MREGPAFLFDLDGTLVDSVYQHVLAWCEALEKAGIELSVWRIHRRIAMSGGLFLNALLRETSRLLGTQEATNIQRWHAEAYARLVTQVRPCPAHKNSSPISPRQEFRGPSQVAEKWKVPGLV